MAKGESKQSTEYDKLLDEIRNYKPRCDPFGYEVCDIMRKMAREGVYLCTSEDVARVTATLDLASKLDNAAITKIRSFKDKNSTPKIGELCGIDLLLDLSNAPENAKYELYFKARTILEEAMKKEEL